MNLKWRQKLDKQEAVLDGVIEFGARTQTVTVLKNRESARTIRHEIKECLIESENQLRSFDLMLNRNPPAVISLTEIIDFTPVMMKMRI
jgi:hypothetical protein